MAPYSSRPADELERCERCECPNCANCCDYVLHGPDRDNIVRDIRYCSFHFAILQTMAVV